MERTTPVLGVSVAAREIQAEVVRAAACDARILLTGESGVGKDLVARAIHERSRRNRGPFVAINCAAVPDSLLESELFGHLRGSFSGAFSDKVGTLAAAHGGTVLMDEAGEMTLRMQATLLRFLESGEIQRVGVDGRLPIVDVRVISATHRRLFDALSGKSLREDLYYRLNVMHVEIPPLRERREDVPVLLAAFLRGFADTYQRAMPDVSRDALARLIAYPWPGNVRELKNVAERLVLKCVSGRIEPALLPLEIQRGEAGAAPAPLPAPASAPHEELFARLLNGTESFWSGIYEPFMAHDLTRHAVRELVRLGLEKGGHDYRRAAALLRVPDQDFRKVLGFLKKHQCLVSSERLRPTPAPFRVTSLRGRASA